MAADDRRRRLYGVIAIVTIALLASCVIGGVLARRAFFRYAARAALAGEGITCDGAFDVVPDGAYAHASIAPCTCEVSSGPIERIELIDEVTVDLDGDHVTHVHAGRVRASVRAATGSVEAGSLGPVAATLGVPARIGAIVAAASHVAALHPPAVEMTTLDVMQGDQPAVEIETLALDGRSPLGVTAHAITLPSLTGPLGATATVTIDGLSGTATASEVHMTGDLALDGTAPILGNVTRRGHVVVGGTGLDTASPTYRVEL
jgi:hypothetical protein